MDIRFQVRGGEIHLLREIGSGGHGTVYLGERTVDYTQRVAVKLLRVNRGPEATEPVALSSLDHPNIVRLLDQGVSPEGLPYLVLEYVDGLRIDKFCDTGRLRLRARLELLQKVMAGVSHAHRHLVIHADLKPSNILVDAAGEPKLLDFGTARRFGGEQATSLEADFTPAFASPEQRRGERVTAATDVYGLGAMLSILLTGRFAAGGEGVRASELLREMGKGEVEREAEARSTTASALRRSLAGDLDAMLEKALQDEPEKRYPSVEAFSDDVQAYLDDRPIAAIAATRGQRTRKWVIRHRVLAASAAAVAAAMLIAVGGVTVQTARAEYQRHLAELRLQELVRLTSALDGELYASVQGIPQSDKAKATLLRGATETMDKLAGYRVKDATLRVEMAGQYEQLAQLHVRNPSPGMADRKEALVDLDKGIALLAGLPGSGARKLQELQSLRSSLF